MLNKVSFGNLIKVGDKIVNDKEVRSVEQEPSASEGYMQISFIPRGSETSVTPLSVKGDFSEYCKAFSGETGKEGLNIRA